MNEDIGKDEATGGTDFFRSRYHRVLASGYGLIWLATAITPEYRLSWLLENVLVLVTIWVLWRTYNRLPLSNMSYTLIAVFLALHTYGAYYTYAETPIGFWFADQFDFERNHYDRIIHFLSGIMLYWPMREVAQHSVHARPVWIDYIAGLFVVAMSGLYEAIEWLTAVIFAPDVALHFLGSQGDVFDAQKDHALVISGALISFCLALWLERTGRIPKPS